MEGNLVGVINQLTILKEQQTCDTKGLSAGKKCVWVLRAAFTVSVWKIDEAVKKLTGYTDK